MFLLCRGRTLGPVPEAGAGPFGGVGAAAHLTRPQRPPHLVAGKPVRAGGGQHPHQQQQQQPPRQVGVQVRAGGGGVCAATRLAAARPRAGQHRLSPRTPVEPAAVRRRLAGALPGPRRPAPQTAQAQREWRAMLPG